MLVAIAVLSTQKCGIKGWRKFTHEQLRSFSDELETGIPRRHFPGCFYEIAP